MPSRLLMPAFVSIACLIFSSPSYAQSETPYQTGLKAAKNRGATDVQCYARVFARHAERVENAKGQLSWSAQSTPAYNADMRRTCGIDRLALVEQQRARRPNAQATSASGHSKSGAYRAGLIAAKRNDFVNQDCYAKVFSKYAYPVQTPPGATGRWYGYNSPAFASELRTQCPN